MYKTILLEEDVQGDQKILGSTLLMKGYSVIEVASGEGTVKQAISHMPDLILLDTQIPLRLETVKSLKKNKQTASIPIWAMTSNYLPGDREKFLRHGCEFYLIKPVGLVKLLQFVQLIDEQFIPMVQLPDRLRGHQAF